MNPDFFRRFHFGQSPRAIIGAVAFALILSACSNGSSTQIDGISMSGESKPNEQVAEVEERLAGVGFEPHYAGTPKSYAEIKSLPQHSLVYHEYQGQYHYVYADIELCGCVYVGDQIAYQRYQEMLAQ